MPRVSVIIPTYKRPTMLDRAISSVLTQTYKDVEIIVVDDNDPDTDYRIETQDIMVKYKQNKKVKYIKHTENKNGAAARNTGIKHSTGDLLCFLDDDDQYLEEKIEKQVKFLLSYPNYKAVYCGWHRDSKKFIPKKKGVLSYELLAGETKIYTNTIMIWKKVAMEIGGWDENFIRNQEAVFLLRFFNKGYPIGAIPEVLVEIDTTDRSNQLSPRDNKRLYDYYLEYHSETINKLEKENENARKLIYTKRYRGIFYEYLKSGDGLGAIRHYMSVVRSYPLQFNKELVCDILKRIFK